MQTIYDWVTVAIFAALIVIFLQRSFEDGEPRDTIWSYLPPSIGCAVANYLGNQGYAAAAIAVLAAVLAYIYHVIKPDWLSRKR